MRRILLVEDEEQVSASIEEILRMSGYTVESVPDALSAIEMLPLYRPSLILCDILMPEISGLELLERLRNSKEFCTIPIIFLSALNTSQHIREAMLLGADDYITKPFHSNELVAAIDARLKRFDHINRRLVGSMGDVKQTFLAKNSTDLGLMTDNLVNEISDYNQYFLERTETDKAVLLRDINRKVNHLNRLLRNILGYLKPESIGLVTSSGYNVNIADSFSHVSRKMKIEYGDDFCMTVNVAPGVLPLHIDQLDLIILELLTLLLQQDSVQTKITVHGENRPDSYILYFAFSEWAAVRNQNKKAIVCNGMLKDGDSIEMLGMLLSCNLIQKCKGGLYFYGENRIEAIEVVLPVSPKEVPAS